MESEPNAMPPPPPPYHDHDEDEKKSVELTVDPARCQDDNAVKGSSIDDMLNKTCSPFDINTISEPIRDEDQRDDMFCQSK